MNGLSVISHEQLCLFNRRELPVPVSSIQKTKHVIKHTQQKSELNLLPYISIYPTHINYFKKPHWEPVRPERYDLETGEKIRNKRIEHIIDSSRSAEGLVSNIARRKIMTAIEYVLFLAKEKKVQVRLSEKLIKFKVAFITLTLSSEQIHSDNEIKEKLLNHFLIEIKRKYYVKNYVWRAEKQANGNIHFHILIDKFIMWTELRDLWNNIQNKLGYVDRYRLKMIELHKSGFRLNQKLLKRWPAEKQYQAWLKGQKTDYQSPNSTDIHSLKKIKDVGKYVAKYAAKQFKVNGELVKVCPENLKVTGRIWGCNQELSNVKGALVPVDWRIEDFLKKCDSDDRIKTYKADYFSVIYCSISDLLESGENQLVNEFLAYINQVFGIPVDQIIDYG